MEKIFRVTVRRERKGDTDEEYQKIFGDSLVGIYDGKIVAKDKKIIGYTHMGVITGNWTSMAEDMANTYFEYPWREEFMQDGMRIEFCVNNSSIILSLTELSYNYEMEQTIIARAFEKSKSLSKKTQECFKKFYLE